MVDVYLSDRRDTAAAQRFFEGMLDTSGTIPTRITTDTATCYPPALRAVLPLTEHRSSNYLNNGLERDHQHGYPQGEGRVRPMRRFKVPASASSFCRGHTLIRNLIRGFSQLTAGVAPRLRLATAWAALTAVR